MAANIKTTENHFSKGRLLERHKQETVNNGKQLPTTRINCEQITLIWFDSQLGEESPFIDDLRLTEEMLREINDYVLLFSNETQCFAHIESIKSETILFIVAGSCASFNLLDKLHNMRHIDSIFIFCQNKNAYESLLFNKDYHKLMGVFDEQTSLTLGIQRAIELVDRQSAIFSLYNTDKQKSTRDLSRESGSFIFLQLVKQVIQKMLSNNDAMKTSKQEMLDKCRLYYRGNKKEMENIDKFEREYTSSEAIKWYTNDSFVYKLINKALRTEDINALYIYRFYIIDLRACLTENCKLLHETTSKLRVYRGIKMSKIELERLRESVGHLISVNAFFSTSRQQCVSEAYAGAGIKGNNPSISTVFESVIFDIEVNLEQDPDIVLADVRHLSQFKDEDEILFDLGTVFKVQSLKYVNDRHYWKCQMTTSDEGRAIAKEYLDSKKNELNESSDIEIIFGDLLFEMGEWLKSRVYFNSLEERQPNDPRVHFGIARAYFSLNDLNQALSSFKQAYDLCMQSENELLTLAANTCRYACRIHRERGNYNEALAFGNEALELYRRADENDNQLGVTQALISIGLVYSEKGNDDAALKYLQRAHELLKNAYAFDIPDMCICLNYLSFAHHHKGDYDKALDCLMTSLNINQRLLPSNHPNHAAIVSNIGKQYYKQGKYDQALEHLRRASHINESIKSCNHLNVAVTYNNIGKICYRLNQLDEASVYYEKALHLIEQHFLLSCDHVYIAYTWKNMGEIQLARGDLIGALHLFERAHDMYIRIFARDSDHRDIAKCKHLIGLTYIKLDNDDKALDAFDKALQMWTITLPKNHPDLALCHRSMAEFYVRKKTEKAKAIMHFQTALSIYEKRLPIDHQILDDIRNKLSDLKN